MALSLSYFVSTYITKNLKAIASVLSKTDFNAVNENIVLSAESAEIQILIDSYNKMLEALKSSAERLAKSERECGGVGCGVWGSGFGVWGLGLGA